MKLLVLGRTTELRAELKLDFSDFLLPHFGTFCSMWVASGHRDCVNPHFKVAGRMLYGQRDRGNLLSGSLRL